MTLTPEQFNKIALKKDLEELEERLASKKQVGKLQNTMDLIVKDYQNFDAEKTSNLAAHNRLNDNINEVRKNVGMDTIGTV